MVVNDIVSSSGCIYQKPSGATTLGGFLLVATSQPGYIDDITDYNVKSTSVFSFLVEMSCLNCCLYVIGIGLS